MSSDLHYLVINIIKLQKKSLTNLINGWKSHNPRLKYPPAMERPDEASNDSPKC